VAELRKSRNFSGFDLSKLQASLYDMKLAHGTDEYLARFVGWESRSSEQQELALFAIRTPQGEQVRRLVFSRDRKIEDQQRLKMLFALVFSRCGFEVEELLPTPQELGIVEQES
jgi:hypothetical protein